MSSATAPCRPRPTDRVLARYDDGAVAAAEKTVGAGRVIVWTSTLDDSWTDLAVKPIFLPLVHQLVRYLARYEPPPSWLTVGQVLDLTARAKGRGDRSDRIVVTPSGERITQQAPARAARPARTDEQGIYEIRSAGGRKRASAGDRGQHRPGRVRPQRHRPAGAGRGGHRPRDADDGGTGAVREMTREESERRQSLWWYLLFAGLLLLAAETVISNRLSRKEKFL